MLVERRCPELDQCHAVHGTGTLRANRQHEEMD
jgi:hypothetical protein